MDRPRFPTSPCLPVSPSELFTVRALSEFAPARGPFRRGTEAYIEKNCYTSLSRKPESLTNSFRRHACKDLPSHFWRRIDAFFVFNLRS